MKGRWFRTAAGCCEPRKSLADCKQRMVPPNSGLYSRVIRTLLVSGYHIHGFERPTPESFCALVTKHDRLGATVGVHLLFLSESSKALLQRAEKDARIARSTLVVVTLSPNLDLPKEIVRYSLADFFEALGGEVRTGRIFDSNLVSVMDELGHNRSLANVPGKPDDLLELYSEECLEYLLECPVRRYGQERRFEPLPDGIALGRNKFNLFFDAKAYSHGFHPTADDIRRFASYVVDFNNRYKNHVGSISVFLVISGSFSDDVSALKEKASDFLAECSTPLVMMKARDLAAAIKLVRSANCRRTAINWRRILAPEVVDIARLEGEVRRVTKDGIIS